MDDRIISHWMAIIYVVVNLITDIIYHYLDPQVRLGGDRA